MATYYVSPTGSDEGPGTLSQPFGSLQHAHDSARPGDTIYMRGGTYALTQGIRLTNDGTSQNPITVCNYPGETPVLDGSAMTRTGYQGVVLTLESASFNHIKGLEITGAPESGLVIRNASHNNTIEGLDVHHNGRLSEWEGKGICLYGPASNNLLLNNDSHHNRDLHGDNADGFQVSTTGQGNVLRGNRAWANSDDGFDFFNVHDGSEAAPLLIENNWSFDNGWGADGEQIGNGSGFKLGGSRAGTDSTSGGHTVINNMAWGNAGTGFDENGATEGTVLYNNTAYDNGGYNYGFWDQENMFRNNVSLGGARVASSGSDASNSWTLPLEVNLGACQSLDDRVARGERAADGSLPASGFLLPVPDSPLIDRGVDVGLPYRGAAPDLGSFEEARAGFYDVARPTSYALGSPSPDLSLPGSGDVDVAGNSRNNLLVGNDGANDLSGGAGADGLRGRRGDDMLSGGLGTDVLGGGAGRDTFLFDTPDPTSDNVDRITDFSVEEDTIRLENAAFQALPSGDLADDAFFSGGAAHDASDRIIYNPVSGALLYDADGERDAAAIRFATLDPGLALTSSDFVIV